MVKDKYIYSLEMAVRDYELDFQCVVHNSNYQRYLEHARHAFLEEHGGSMTAMHAAGVDPMVSKITIEYKSPLRGGDKGRELLRRAPALMITDPEKQVFTVCSTLHCLQDVGASS